MSKYIKKDENGFYVFDEIEFSKTLPTGLEYFAVCRETEQIYNLGFNYKEKLEKQIADLEAKLAESEIKCYTLESYNNFVNNQCKKLIKENKQLKQKLADIDQDKISFAVEQLEKVRKFAEDMWGIYKAEEVIEEFIKDQIKQLKEKK